MSRTGTKRDADTSTTDINELAPLDIQNSCIWTSQEIDVLRAVFKTASSQNNELRASLAATKQELEIIQQKHRVKSKILNTEGEHLSEAKKANERLKILCDNLKAQNKEAEKKILAQDKETKAYSKWNREHLKKILELQKEADLERLQREEIETTLTLQSQEALREQILREENLKTLHAEDMRCLQNKISELRELLTKEKKDHERTKKGLYHLRTHFASLPLTEEAATNNVVASDQLKQWTYR